LRKKDGRHPPRNCCPLSCSAFFTLSFSVCDVQPNRYHANQDEHILGSRQVGHFHVSRGVARHGGRKTNHARTLIIMNLLPRADLAQ
jgi:hypothetical protein